MYNMFTSFCAFTILSLVALANGQVIKYGKCPDYKIADNFDPAKYFSGKFYEQKKFWNLFELNSKCIHAEYQVTANGTVRVENSGLSTKTSKRVSQVGEAYCEEKAKAKCHVRFYPGTPYGGYNLLAADPDKYGLVFSCTQLVPNLVNTQYAWILTRDKKVSDEDMKSYLNVFKANGVDVDSFEDCAQDCIDN